MRGKIFDPLLIFYFWPLTRPLQDLNVFLLEPLHCCLGHAFWVIVMLEYPSMTHFQYPGWLQCPGPDGSWPCSLSLWCGAVVLSPKHNISTSMFDGVDGHRQHSSSSSKHDELSWCQKAGFWSHLTTTLSLSSILWIIAKLVCAFLSRGTLRALQDFSHSRRSVLPIVFLVTMVPAALRSLTRCSSGLIPHRSHDHWNSTRWDLAWSLSPREIDSYFVFLPFANYHTNCCHLLTKLLGDGHVAHSSLV